MPDIVYSATELIDRQIGQVSFDGKDVDLTTGHVRLHAVRHEPLKTFCASEQSRLLPTGQPWADTYPDHIARCSTCVEMVPPERT